MFVLWSAAHHLEEEKTGHPERKYSAGQFRQYRAGTDSGNADQELHRGHLFGHTHLDLVRDDSGVNQAGFYVPGNC